MWLPCGWANRDVDAVTDATGHDGFVCCIRFYHGRRAAQPLSAAVLSLLRPARVHGFFLIILYSAHSLHMHCRIPSKAVGPTVAPPKTVVASSQPLTQPYHNRVTHGRRTREAIAASLARAARTS